MKKSWPIWLFVAGIFVTVLIAFNYESGQKTVSLSEIFPDEETVPVEIEYEFANGQSKKEPVPKKVSTPRPIVKPSRQTDTSVKDKAQSTPVPPKPLPKQSVVSQPSPSQKSSGEKKSLKGYTIQVASFRARSRADQFLEQMGGWKKDAFIVAKNLGDKGTWHRVYVGMFDSKSEAEDLLAAVKKKYPECLIIYLK